MVTAAFSALSRSTRANYAFISQAVARGDTAKTINDALIVRTGKGIRRQDLLAGMRVAGGVQREGRAIQNVRLDRRPSYQSFPTFQPITSNKKYLVQYEIRTLDSKTGDRSVKYITVGTDSLLTRAELDQAARDAYESGQREKRYGDTQMLVGIVPVGARQQVI